VAAAKQPGVSKRVLIANLHGAAVGRSLEEELVSFDPETYSVGRKRSTFPSPFGDPCDIVDTVIECLDMVSILNTVSSQVAYDDKASRAESLLEEVVKKLGDDFRLSPMPMRQLSSGLAVAAGRDEYEPEVEFSPRTKDALVDYCRTLTEKDDKTDIGLIRALANAVRPLTYYEGVSEDAAVKARKATPQTLSVLSLDQRSCRSDRERQVGRRVFGFLLRRILSGTQPGVIAPSVLVVLGAEDLDSDVSEVWQKKELENPLYVVEALSKFDDEAELKAVFTTKVRQAVIFQLIGTEATLLSKYFLTEKKFVPDAIAVAEQETHTRTIHGEVSTKKLGGGVSAAATNGQTNTNTQRRQEEQRAPDHRFMDLGPGEYFLYDGDKIADRLTKHCLPPSPIKSIDNRFEPRRGRELNGTEIP
jgi:hypothetical protein